MIKSDPSQIINGELIYGEYMKAYHDKYGLFEREKFGDIIVNQENQNILPKMVEKHYKKTKFKDYKESVREMKEYFNPNSSLIIEQIK